MQSDSDLQWFKVETGADADHLMDKVGGFHDGCIREFYSWTGHFVDESLSMHADPRANLRLLIQLQWKHMRAVELVFGGVALLHWTPSPPECSDDISDAWVVRHGDLWMWTDNWPEWNASSVCVQSRELWWRDASEWLGPTSRLGLVHGSPTLIPYVDFVPSQD
ncbi:MAG: hypothetical protein U0S12_00695 [Fimbriimonadales bacterium]